jgi:3-deoxy-7-phosphoheptulonate synthase
MFNVKNIIAGGCSLESYDESCIEIECLLNNGCNKFRAMLWKPRTSPDSFQGIGSEGINIIFDLHKKYPEVIFVTEVMDYEQLTMLDIFSTINKINFIYQIGARNSQNFSLLKRFGSYSNINILYKRGMSQSIQEYIDGSKYLMPKNNNIIMCLRGIRTFETETRNTCDIDAICVLKDRFEFIKDLNYKIYFDPSHACGNRKYVEQLAVSAVIVGADGLEIEIHSHPDDAKVDSKQTIDFNTFDNIIKKITKINEVLYEEL